jgi:hypothetical protein
MQRTGWPSISNIRTAAGCASTESLDEPTDGRVDLKKPLEGGLNHYEFDMLRDIGGVGICAVEFAHRLE